MPIGLENSLTSTAAREIDHANKRAQGLGESMTTGFNKFAEVVDKFLGSSLKDNEIMLGAIAKNTAYSINMLTITDEYLSSISSSLQNGISTIISAGTVSKDKLNVLQKNLNDMQTQISLLTRTADFDGKKLLSGKADMAVQVGLSVADSIAITIENISNGSLTRNSVAKALNAHLATGNVNLTAYYDVNAASRALLLTDAAAQVNLVEKALHAGAAPMTDQQLGDAIRTISQAAAAGDTSFTDALQEWAPITATALGGQTFATANANQIQVALAANGNDGFKELKALVSDTMDLSTAAGRTNAQETLNAAQNDIRAMQANVSNQKSNVAAAADALRSTTNVTQKAADSYLKTDYVMTAQQYSETIKRMVASITTLQAANKIPEAAQRLIDALAR